MPVQLWSPREAGELYLYRGEEVNPLRPLFTGDVVAGLTIDGVGPGTGYDSVLLVDHPCTMREGHAFRNRLSAVPVRVGRPLPFDRWDRERFDRFPLPELDAGAPDVALEAALDERGSVSTEESLRAARVACLSDQGVMALLQRLNLSQTRVRTTMSLIEDSLMPVLLENELAEEWNDGFIDADDVTDDERRLAAMAREAEGFDGHLSQRRKVASDDGYKVEFTLRDQLRVQPDRVRSFLRAKVIPAEQQVRARRQPGT